MNVSVFVNVKQKQDFFLSKFPIDNMNFNVFATQRGSGLSPLMAKVISSQMDVLTKMSYLNNSDIALSMDTIHGTLLSFTQSVYRLKNPSHVLVDSSSLPIIGSKFSLWKYLKKVFSSTRQIICFSSYQANFWNSIFGADKAVFTPLGVDSDFYSPVDLEPSDYVFSAGRTARDIGTLLAVAKQVDQKFVVIVGNNMRSVIDLRDVPKNVQLYFEVPPAFYKALLAKSKIVLLTLHNVPYSCGLSVLLHAMSMGKPVIVTRVPSTMDYVSNWDTGVFVEPYDVTDLKQKISYLLCNYNIAKKIGANARSQAQNMFSERAMAFNFAKILNNVYNEN